MKIPERPGQRWDGGFKSRTKDCDDCEFYRKINDTEICAWGIAFKYLSATQNPRKCDLLRRGKIMYQESSAPYVDAVIRKKSSQNS